MSKVYGKALGAYRKINNIKSSMMKVEEARVDIQTKRQQAASEAEDLMAKKNLTSKMFGGAITAAGIGLQQGNVITGDEAKFGAAGLSAIKDIAIDASYNEREKNFARDLGASDYGKYRDQTASASNIFSNALDQYSLFEGLNSDKKTSDLSKQINDTDSMETIGISDDQLREHRKESAKFERFKGWNTNEKEAVQSFLADQKQSGLINDNEYNSSLSNETIGYENREDENGWKQNVKNLMNIRQQRMYKKNSR